MEFPPKLKTEPPCDPATPLLDMYLREMKLKSYLHSHVHSNIIFNSQGTETT